MRLTVASGILLSMVCSAATSQQPNTAKQWPTHEDNYHIANFHFKDGETIDDLRLNYITLGTLHRDAAGHADNAVLLLHGTGGQASTLMNPIFSNELFGPGQPLDITKYFLILPADIGHGKSSKPSDGLHMKFPQYDYDDMVASQHQMLVEGLKVDHLRLILGTSMGCMQSFVWGETYPGFADALAPFACQAVALAGRNREWRYMAMQAIKSDPAWMGGEYKTEPIVGLTFADELNLLVGGAPLQLQKNYPTRQTVEKYVDESVARALAMSDANDYIYYTNASRNYDPSKWLAKITVPVLWINSADDFINPPELGLAQQQVKEMPRGRFILLPITDDTRGHGTHTVAKIWKGYLVELLKESEKK
jgi:homoserine O-acetyltransferase